MGYEKDFLIVGLMGYIFLIVFGVVMQKFKRQIFCLDGDGLVIMYMGVMVIVGQFNLDNFKYIVINNGVYDLVGGQLIDVGNYEDFFFFKIV